MMACTVFWTKEELRHLPAVFIISSLNPGKRRSHLLRRVCVERSVSERERTGIMNSRIVQIIMIAVHLIIIASCGLLESDMEEIYEDYSAQMVVDGTEISYTIAIPNSYSDSVPAPLILALHFGGQPSRYYGGQFMNQLVKPALKDLKAIILAPTVPMGGNWTNEGSQDAVMGLMREIKEEYSIDSENILVTGFSLGGIGTWEYASKYPEVFAAAIPISSMPSEGIVDTISGIPLYVIHSKADQIFPWRDVDGAVQQLQSRGLEVQFILLEGITHYETGRFIGPLKDAVPWIREKW